MSLATKRKLPMPSHDDKITLGCGSAQSSDFKLSGYQTPAYRTYVLALLTVVYVFSFIDRQLLSILQESIKQELMLTDTHLGLLTGFSFALFYVTAGIPIARLADNSNRRNIIAVAACIWSVMTAMSGMAANYVQLLLARIGVGVGEAGCSPPAHSMISDIYPPQKRATAMAIYSVGVNAGVLLGFLFGGILNEYFGWRVAFVVVGVPGIVLALLVRFTVAEPIRGMSEQQKIATDKIPFKVALSSFTRSKTLLHLCLGASATAMAGYAAVSWSAPFFIRTHQLGTAELGAWLAVGSGLFAAIGTFSAGVICDKWGQKDRRWYLWIPALAMFITLPCQLFVLMSTSTYQALTVNLLVGLLMTCYIGPSLAILHGSVDVRMRSTASAIFFFFINIIGLGVGPSLVGMISDQLAPSYGNESLRYAMLAVIPFACLWAVFHFLMAAHRFKQDRSINHAKAEDTDITVSAA